MERSLHTKKGSFIAGGVVLFIILNFIFLISISGAYANTPFKLKDCDLNDANFKETIMKEIKADHEQRKSGARENYTLSKILSERDIKIDKDFNEIRETKEIYYYGFRAEELLRNDFVLPVSFSSRLEIKEVTACTIYFDEIQNKWVALNQKRISQPMPKGSSRDNMFSDETEINVLIPTAQVPFYVVTKKLGYMPALKGLPKGVSLYIDAPYSSKYQCYNHSWKITLPEEMGHSSAIRASLEPVINNFTVNNSIKDGKITYTLKVDNPSVFNELKADTDNEQFPYFAFSTFSSWEHAIRLIADIYEQKISEGKQELARELEIIKKYYPNPRVIDVYTYVTRFYRYEYYHNELIGNRTPHSINEITSLKAGDCKDLTLLTVGLLRELGYRSYPALIRTTDMRNYDLEYDVPVDRFDHIMPGYYNENDEFKLLEATAGGASNYSGSLLSVADRNYITWLYNEFRVIKGRSPKVESSGSYYDEVNIDATSPSKVECKILFNYDLCEYKAGSLNMSLNVTPGPDKKDTIINHLFDVYGDLSYVINENIDGFMSISGDINIKGPSGITRQVYENNDQIFIKYEAPRIIEGERISDYIYDQETRYLDYVVTYKIPENYVIESVPENFHYDSEYLLFDVKIEIIGNSLKYQRLTWYKKSIIPREDYAEEAERMQAISNYVREPMVFTRK